MRTSFHTRLSRALNRREISPALRIEILNAVFFKQSDARIEADGAASFDPVLSDARLAKRAILSNKAKWVPELVHLYERYVQVVQTAVDDIESARALMLKNPDDPKGTRVPSTLTRITALATKRNDAARANHQPLGPACNANWPSWVDPAVRRELVDEFDRAYALMGRGRGRRFTPFATTSILKDMTHAVRRHRKFIDDQRAAVSDRPHGMGSTPYRALHLAALRMAELWLDGYEKDIKSRVKHPALDPVPVNWMHLLTSDMRSRVRDADANPASVTPEGLTSFLQTNTTE